MRITGGIWRGRRLEAPATDLVRPTSDKVRQAVFNMIEARDPVDGAHVLDAFCGTGALGLEALSRGAARAVFFDKNKKSLALCQQNYNKVNSDKNPGEGAAKKADFLLRDVTKPGNRPAQIHPAGLIFLDPPYGRELAPLALSALVQGDWLAPQALCVIEAGKDENVAAPGFSVIQQKIYGSTKIILIREETVGKSQDRSKA